LVEYICAKRLDSLMMNRNFSEATIVRTEF
jgi:hypothetical protein